MAAPNTLSLSRSPSLSLAINYFTCIDRMCLCRFSINLLCNGKIKIVSFFFFSHCKQKIIAHITKLAGLRLSAQYNERLTIAFKPFFTVSLLLLLWVSVLYAQIFMTHHQPSSLICICPNQIRVIVGCDTPTANNKIRLIQ